MPINPSIESLAVIFMLLCICFPVAWHYPVNKGEEISPDSNNEEYRILVRKTPDQEEIESTLTQNGHHHQIVVTLFSNEETLELDLRLNTHLFSAGYIEKILTDTGEIFNSVNHTEGHCYYIGNVRNKSHSTAAVSTCRGIDGYFAIGDVTYHIEPMGEERRLNGSHRVRRSQDDVTTNFTCGVDDSFYFYNPRTNHRERRAFLWPQDATKQNKVLEVYVANDKSQYLNLSSNDAAVFDRTKKIANVASSLYQPLGIYIVLVGVEIWRDFDRIVINASDKSSTLRKWNVYRAKNINPTIYNDVGVLITHVTFDNAVLGLAYVGTICSNQLSSTFISDIFSRPNVAGTTMAHELGHNLGLTHDASTCSCPDTSNKCIMSPYLNSAKPPINWSQCSTTALDVSFQHGNDICLYDISQTIFQSTISTCGNGIIETGEQCDCGNAPSQQCNKECCNSTTCKLNPPASCASGRCCDVTNCRIQSSETVCRPKSDVCDVGEYCDGQQSICPTDTYMPDGTNCNVNGDAAYCYQGRCRSHRSQCELIWGTGTLVSDSICYSQFNIAGEHYGNCGFTWLPNVTYIPCPTNDVMCGKLQCQGSSQTLAYYSRYYEMSAPNSIGSASCCSVIFDYGLRTIDPGLVPNGAKCAEGKMCLNKQCVNVANVNITSCTSSCKENEICNNLGQCQRSPPEIMTDSTDQINASLPIIIGCVVGVLGTLLIAALVIICCIYCCPKLWCAKKKAVSHKDDDLTRIESSTPDQNNAQTETKNDNVDVNSPNN